MRKILLDYYMPFRNLFKFEEDMERFQDWYAFKQQWYGDKPTLVILPLAVFPLVGLDIRYQFREFGRNNNTRFLLIGTIKQIEFALSQNDKFVQNIIEQIVLPMDFDVLEIAVLKKIKILEKQIKGK
jgi:hypothetical protein